jgi:hypothetical protein
LVREAATKGLRAFGRVYAGWRFSQTFYRVKADIEKMGYASLEDFLVGFWEGLFLTRDANNLLAASSLVGISTGCWAASAPAPSSERA